MSDNDDFDELAELLESGDCQSRKPRSRGIAIDEDPCTSSDSAGRNMKNKDVTYIQWTKHGDLYLPAGKTTDHLVPGVYEIRNTEMGIAFEKIPVKTEGLLIFPDTNSDKIVAEIENFWEREHLFKQYGLTYKRGIILWGPPGSGKSCTLQLIMADVIKRGGIVLQFANPGLFIAAMRIFRKIQPDTPVVVTMEDIDSLIQGCESEILNILDGAAQVEKVVFLATTNYPSVLGKRIINRPSRFDKRFKIGFPSDAARKMYLEHIIGEATVQELNIDLDRWVQETEGFSLAHLKELFVAVVILGDDYEKAVATLSRMNENIDDREPDDKMGFATGLKKSRAHYASGGKEYAAQPRLR